VATRAQCEEALRIYAEALCGFPNVVRCDIGSSGGNDAHIVVFVTKKLPYDAIEPDDLIPSYLQLVELSGVIRVPTQVVEAGH